MQETSGELASAIERSSVIWDPRLFADWNNDGYGTIPGSIDDLSNQSENYQVEHAAGDGMPEEVAFVRKSGVPTLAADLSGRDPLSATQYFSPLRTDSPVYGYDRDVADVKLDIAAVTDTGLDDLRVFTGIMSDTSVLGGKAKLTALSRTRLDLSMPVQPRAMVRTDREYSPGLNATWPITWALYECERYASPPPRSSGCRLFMPLHGGLGAYLPHEENLDAAKSVNGTGIRRRPLDLRTLATGHPKWIRGPYAGALYGEISEVQLRGAFVEYLLDGTLRSSFAEGEDWMSQDGGIGRVEFWLRGDSFDVGASPGGGTDLDPWGVGYEMIAGFYSLGDTVFLLAGVNSARQPFVQVFDGSTLFTFEASNNLPEDGLWHRLGMAWDLDAGDVWTYLDGTEETDNLAISFPGSFPPTLAEDPEQTYGFQFYLPAAEVHFCTGDGFQGDQNDWIYEIAFDQKAVVYPSRLELEALIQTEPVQAFELIASYSQAEQAQITIDEHDIFHYRPRGYFYTAQALSQVETIDTDNKAALPEVIVDSSRIRTVVRVSFDQVTVDQPDLYITEYTQVAEIPTGQTLFTLALDDPAIRVWGGAMSNLTQNQVDGVDTTPVGSYIAVYPDPEGVGTIGTDADVSAEIVAWTPGNVTIEFTNYHPASWWLVNVAGDGGYGSLGVFGVAAHETRASVTEENEASSAIRGARGLTATLDRVQRPSDAYRAARQLVLELARPINVIRAVELFGDPRRQVGDLVQFTDPYETGIADQFRIYGVSHTLRAGDYRQNAAMQAVKPLMVWGQTTWGHSCWAGQEAEVQP